MPDGWRRRNLEKLLYFFRFCVPLISIWHKVDIELLKAIQENINVYVPITHIGQQTTIMELYLILWAHISAQNGKSRKSKLFFENSKYEFSLKLSFSFNRGLLKRFIRLFDSAFAVFKCFGLIVYFLWDKKERQNLDCLIISKQNQITWWMILKG